MICYKCLQSHCAKNVPIRSFFWSLFSRIWTEYGKTRTRKSPKFGLISRSSQCSIKCIKWKHGKNWNIKHLLWCDVKIRFNLFQLLKQISVSERMFFWVRVRLLSKKTFFWMSLPLLTLSWRRPSSYRNQEGKL